MDVNCYNLMELTFYEAAMTTPRPLSSLTVSSLPNAPLIPFPLILSPTHPIPYFLTLLLLLLLLLFFLLLVNHRLTIDSRSRFKHDSRT